MGFSYTNAFPILLILCIFLISIPSLIADAAGKTFLNHSISAIYVFGDSTVDPGNNNYITTIFKSDFPPYGQDLPNHDPTGRFCNGKLVTDFIAFYLGIKEYVPPYLDNTLSMEELMTGVSFASAGSGYDPLTARISRVIPVQKQLEYFKEYKARLELVMGKKGMEVHVQKALYIVSAGTNDFVINYFGIPIRRLKYNLTDYQSFMLQNTRNFVQDLMDLGAQRIGIGGLPPMGCLPVVITLNSDQALLQRGCINSYQDAAIEYNRKLENELQSMQRSVKYYRARIIYINIYQPVFEVISGWNNFGFVECERGCCGTGLLEASFLCNPKSFVCPDASKYIFWDSIHPTERTYYILFKAVRGLINLLAM